MIDEPAVEVVREICAFRLSGMNTEKIADTLNGRGTLSPMEYKRALGLNFESDYKVNNEAKWTAVAVGCILKSAVYTGVLEQGKRTTPNYKVKTVIEHPESEWFRVENAHEPIIDEYTWTCVQRRMESTRRATANNAIRANGSGEDNLFSGIIRCADCGAAMALVCKPIKKRRGQTGLPMQSIQQQRQVGLLHSYHRRRGLGKRCFG